MLVLTAVAMLLTAVVRAADPATTAEACWTEAVEAYAAKHYDKAVESLEHIIALGYGSAEVYYNLGNAYFKLGQSDIDGSGRPFASGELGRAILNYRRALKLDPSLEDARYNLEIAVDHTNDTEAIPHSFIVRLWHSLRDMATSNSWAWLSLLSLVVMLATALIYLLSQHILYRKIAFFVAVTALVLFILTTLLALSQRRAANDNTKAVVVCSDTTPVHASPDSSSKIIRQPSQGVTLRIIREQAGWQEILFSDGEKGWIRKSVVERI